MSAPLPVLKALAGTDGSRGDKKLSLERIGASKLTGAPREWCNHARYTSLLRVRGHSREPRIGSGDILAVDSLQTDPSKLVGKLVVVIHEENGFCVSRFRRYETLDVLQSESPQYKAIVLGRNSGWRVVGRVLGWISAAS